MTREGRGDPDVTTGPEDAAVVARVLGGEVEAFGLLIRRYEPELLRCATRLLGSADNAADAVAEGFVRAFRHLASCRDPRHVRAWLYRIVLNRCKTRLARPGPEVPLEDAPPIAARDDPAAELERSEEMARVQRALGTLSRLLREAFVLRHVEGLSYDEMAAATGVGVPTLRVRVQRAREALIAALEEEA